MCFSYLPKLSIVFMVFLSMGATRHFVPSALEVLIFQKLFHWNPFFGGSCSHGSLRVWFIISFLLPDERRLEILVLSNPFQLSNNLDAICGLKNVLGIPIRHFFLSNCKFTSYPHTRPYFLQLKECCMMLMVHGIV